MSRGDPEAYNSPCDMWALGIIMYYLISGERPFNNYGNTPDLIDAIMNSDVIFDQPCWTITSSKAKEFIKVLLRKKPGQRLTA